MKITVIALLFLTVLQNIIYSEEKEPPIEVVISEEYLFEKRLKQYGIMPYDDLQKKLKKQKDYEALYLIPKSLHHLFPKRKDITLSFPARKVEVAVLGTKWKKVISKNKTLTPSLVLSEARIIYKRIPELMGNSKIKELLRKK